jgi:hypothetical protein
MNTKLLGAATALGFLSTILQVSIGNTDVLYTYTGFPLDSVIIRPQQQGPALGGQGVFFSFTTTTFLAANLSLNPNQFIAVPVNSWSASAGPYSQSGSGSTGLFELSFQTDLSGLITGWNLFLGTPGPDVTLNVISVAPLTSTNWLSKYWGSWKVRGRFRAGHPWNV